MKLKSLKFVLPILLVLPSLVFADWIYQRTPTGTEITSPVSLYFKWEDWNSDMCRGDPWCVEMGRYWGFYLNVLIEGNEQQIYGETYDKTIKEIIENFDLPVGAQVRYIDVYVFAENQLPVGVIVVESGFPAFTIIGTSTPPTPPPSGTIGNTQNWLSSNEILGYIGKLAEDIPNYIALMIGLPIAFWFVEKIIAFVRGNFRPVEKIKEE
jgi:hypothetical protein